MRHDYYRIASLIILISIVLIYSYFNKNEGFQIQDIVTNTVNSYRSRLRDRIRRITPLQDFTQAQYSVLEQINKISYPELYNKIESLSDDNLKQLLHDTKLYMDIYEKQKGETIVVNNLVIWLNNYIKLNNW